MRQSLLDQFVEVRSVMKTLISKLLFRAKAKQLYEDCLQELKEEEPEEQQLKLSGKKIHGWMEEHNMSLRQPYKHFAMAMGVKKPHFWRPTACPESQGMVQEGCGHR